MRAPPVSLPDMFANHLHVKLFSTVAAFRANAEALSINFDDLINVDSVSPFYTASMTPDLAEALVRAKFGHLKADLQPTVAQIQHTHHPYIDIIPSPVFRQRVIQALSVEPPMIDEDDSISIYSALLLMGSCRPKVTYNFISFLDLYSLAAGINT